MFETLTDMIDLAFSLAPLLMLIVIMGMAFRFFAQFRDGTMYGGPK